ncbi:MAG: DUF4437 domain-containing protein [Pseudomonadota bacterium]
MTRPHIEPFVELNDAYKPFKLPGFVGTDYKVLSLDVDTGACSLKVRFKNGFSRPPGLSYSDWEMFVLTGSARYDEQTLTEGHYLFVPAGVSTPVLNVDDGCEALLFFNDAEPHFEESDAHHDLALTAGIVSLNAYGDAPWSSGSIVSPSVASGCMIKLLRFDPLTEAMTFLYMMSPEFMQDNISYHDCAEESYHIWGDSWMMQFGDLPTGGYFWRPPYINHGSFRCKLGCIAIGRTDSKLHNYFHFNPWTNPDENLQRAAAFLYRQRPQLFKWVAAAGGHNHPHGPVGQADAVALPSDFESPDYLEHPQTAMLAKQVFRFLDADRSGKHHHHDD